MGESKQLQLIAGGSYQDERGTLKHFNTFNPGDFRRFYIIEQSPSNGPRAWQGHKTEAKCFYCLKGRFAVLVARIDNWETPGNSPDTTRFDLSGEKNQMLLVPGGYANGIKALEKDSQLMVFSEYAMEEAVGDEQRFSKDRWIKWEKI